MNIHFGTAVPTLKQQPLTGNGHAGFETATLAFSATDAGIHRKHWNQKGEATAVGIGGGGWDSAIGYVVDQSGFPVFR